MNPLLQDQLVGIRRLIHRHPELAWREQHTAETVEAFLDQFSIAHHRVAETGVIADLAGEQATPVIVLRADLDALPIQEETKLPFASKIAGRMHACGHDGHTAMLLGCAAMLSQAPVLPLSTRFLFQPAEEQGQGAKAMIEAGALSDVVMAFGAHLDPHYAIGTVIVTDGTVNASSDTFTIHIDCGSGGHAARPHEATDAVVIGSLLVMTIQTIISREVNPSHPSVITIGTFQSGSAPNIIANRCVMRGTIRCHDPELRECLRNSIERVASSIGQLHGATIEVEIVTGTPALVNNPDAVAISRDAARRIVGDSNVWAMDYASMGAEDFSYIAEEVPSCYARIGAHSKSKPNHPLHSSKFDFDEEALIIGADYFAEVAKLAGATISSLRTTTEKQSHQAEASS